MINLRFTLLFTTVFFLFSCSTSSLKVEVLIKGGTIIDGTGSESFIGHIGIAGDTIVFIGKKASNADKVIDAKGMIVSPGFIDPHTHSLGELQSDDKNHNLNYLMQGVTTVFNGNDGGGPFNLDEAEANLNPNGIGTNVAFFVGHGTVRREVMGMEDTAPNPSQLEEMKALVRQGMETGAFGLSTGLYYVPGSYATTEEVIELTKEIVPFKGTYDSHIRDESTYNIGLINAVKEVLEIGQQSGAAVHFAHLKALGVDVWGKSQEIIDMVEQARTNGLKVSADQYPWNASGTRVEAALVNGWVKAGGEELYTQRLNDGSLLPRIREEVKENIRRRGGGESLLITGGNASEEIVGKNLAQIAEEMNVSEVEAALAICRNGGARIASFNMNEEDIENFMVQDWVMSSSDGSTGHPRKFASYPRKYQKYVAERNLFPIETFVYKSSGQVATNFGMKRRGMLKEGYYADVIVFNPEAFVPKADFSSPEVYSEGISFAIVNGKVAIDNGEYTGELNGQLIRKN